MWQRRGVSWRACGGQRTAGQSLFSPSTQYWSQGSNSGAQTSGQVPLPTEPSQDLKIFFLFCLENLTHWGSEETRENVPELSVLTLNCPGVLLLTVSLTGFCISLNREVAFVKASQPSFITLLGNIATITSSHSWFLIFQLLYSLAFFKPLTFELYLATRKCFHCNPCLVLLPVVSHLNIFIRLTDQP